MTKRVARIPVAVSVSSASQNIDPGASRKSSQLPGDGNDLQRDLWGLLNGYTIYHFDLKPEAPQVLQIRDDHFQRNGGRARRDASAHGRRWRIW